MTYDVLSGAERLSGLTHPMQYKPLQLTQVGAACSKALPDVCTSVPSLTTTLACAPSCPARLLLAPLLPLSSLPTSRLNFLHPLF